MERLSLVLIGDTDVLTICLEEALAAGHEVRAIVSDLHYAPPREFANTVEVIHSADILTLSVVVDLIYVFCSPHYHQHLLIPNRQCLSFNNNLLQHNKNNDKELCVWFASAEDGFFHPIQSYLPGLDTHEEIIRESFIDVLAHLSRDSLSVANIPTLINTQSLNASPLTNLYEAFLHTANQYPDSIALVHDSHRLSYAQLLDKVIKASCLIPECLNNTVALYFRRGINMVVGLLAVLRANAAYLPLDPKNPLARNQLILNDSNVQLLLCDEETQDDAKLLKSGIECASGEFSEESDKLAVFGKFEISSSDNTTGFTVVSDESVFVKPPSSEARGIELIVINWHDLPPYEHDRWSESGNARNNSVAYVIYTSGSTGIPKGVRCTHQGALNMVMWTIEHYPIKASDKVVQLASYAFDISVWELFAPLLSGGCLILASDVGYSDPAYINQLIQKENITVAHMIPSILNLYLDQLEHSSSNSLIHVVSGGEELRPFIANKFFKLLPNSRLYHGYGPTECAITCIHHTVTPHSYEDFIPIGFPIANTGLFLVDEYLRIMPNNYEGEGLIFGSGLAEGYLNNPAETKKKFLANGTFYKTGDRFKKLGDGSIQYLGRIDKQLKIRGNRVELEEIERVIMGNTCIKACSVQPIHLQDTLLIAYCVFDTTNEELAQQELKEYLLSCLPSYMVPNRIISLLDLPRTVNGKINVKALRDIYEQQLSQSIVRSEYFSPIEMNLIDFFRTELKLPFERTDVSLASLGLSSLSLIYLINHIETHYSVRIKPLVLYELQTIASLANWIAHQKTDNKAVIGREISRANRYSTLPLSHAQSRLWFLHQLEEQQSAAYNILQVYLLDGSIDRERLTHAFNKVIARHEILRTRFPNVYGRAHQVIDQATPIDLDLEQIDANTLNDHIYKMGNYHFQLEKEVSFKVKLYQLAVNKYVLVILQHNIITDGWSGGILLKELNYYYHNLSADKLQKSNIHYADYAAWQKTRLASTILNKELEYWHKKLHNVQFLNIALDKPRPSRQTFNGAISKTFIPSSQLHHIDAFIKKETVTLYMYLVTVLNVVFARYTDQTDIIIGTGYAGRDKEELKDMMGFFVNTLPLRTQFSHQDNFTQALNICKTVILEAMSHSEIPFDVLVDKLKIEREPNSSPLFQILFLMQDAADNIHLILDGIKAKPIDFDLGISIYDITFNVHKDDEGLHLSAQYNTDLFYPETISAFLAHFKEAIEYFPGHEEENIYEISLLNLRDKAIIKQFNTIPTVALAPNSLLTWLDSVLKQFPDNLALCELPNKVLTYRQLDEYSTIFAASLYQQYGTNKIIGIYMDKSIEFFISLIAIIKSGNAYLIIDVEMPSQRVSYILKNSEAAALIVGALSVLSESIDCPLVVYAQPEKGNDELILPKNQSSLCYLLYTSGSTGLPKGVNISQANLLNTLNYFCQRYAQKETNILSLTSVSFDIFQLELFLPLLSGGTCYFYNKSLVYCKDELMVDLPQLPIDLIQATPSGWKLILASCPDLMKKTIALVGGEALPADLLHSLQDRFKQVFNVYGPTETTIWSSIADLSTEKIIHLGQPIANTTILLVDSRNQPVPIGCLGEIAIGGASVCSSYSGERTENQTRFFSMDYADLGLGEQRFYKTGDKARFTQQGLLIYQGRMDDQIKLRGYRIELNEIASVVKKFSTIEDAVVTVLPLNEQKEENTLVCFIIDNNGIVLNRLIEHCKHLLPAYMVPGQFIPVQKIPLNTNGKIDYFQLKNIYQKHNSGVIEQAQPMSITEQLLADIWKESIGINMVDLKTSFFYLGGSSLLIAELIAETNKQFNTALTIRDFINGPTISQQAKLIDAIRHQSKQKDYQLEVYQHD